LTIDNLIDVAQSVVDDLTQEVLPHKLAIVKMVNINTGEEIISLPSEFSLDFSSPSEVRSSGNPVLGRILMNLTPINFEIENKIVATDADENDDGTNSGSAYIYDLDGTNEIKITASDVAENDYFGYSVTVSDSKIVIGAYGNDDDGSYSGSAYIYDLDGTNEIKLTASDAAEADRFGNSVAVSNSKIVIGANNSNTGSAYIYG